MSEFWGIDAEGTYCGLERTQDDIHSVQVCPSNTERRGRVFHSSDEFKKWLRYREKHGNLPEIFFAYTLPYEYGTLLGWELLGVGDSPKKGSKGKYPWQNWADHPVNLFYLKFRRKRIPVFDIRIFFFQLRYGNNYLTSLERLGDYLSDFYGEDIRKLPKPLGEDFGRRPPTEEEMDEFHRYGIRDAYISAKGAQWVHENVLDTWLSGRVGIEKLYSWGTVAKYFFELPKLNEFRRFKGSRVVEFPNLWHEQIFMNTFAGRNEAFSTGRLGQLYYNDVSSLYPVSMIQTQCMLIRDVGEWFGDTDGLMGSLDWERFYGVTGYPYGWILGDFETEDDLWGLPVKVGQNNYYVTGELRNCLRHTLDLEASGATVNHVNKVLVPVYDKGQRATMRKFEELTLKKLEGRYDSQIEKYCIKSTVNSASGILGKSKPSFGTTTNLPAYNTLLAQSHLNMSKIFHLYRSPGTPIHYTDTDSFFSPLRVEEVVEQCEPYPGLPFQLRSTIPLELGVRGESCEEGTVIFRGKMYYQDENSMAFSGWKPFPQFFSKIVLEKPIEITVERQVNRKWKTRDRKATVLKTGRWIILREHWDIKKLKRIFRADGKRFRESYDSYQLFLDGEGLGSRSWDSSELSDKFQGTWKVEYRMRPYMAWMMDIEFEPPEDRK